MPRPKGTGKGRAKPATIRLPDDEDAFYRRKANEAGLSLFVLTFGHPEIESRLVVRGSARHSGGSSCTTLLSA